MKWPLSVCVPAKNEEELLPHCLEPFRHRAAEILVCDTGSSDRTASIAESLGARVVSLRPANDLSRIRNRLIELSRNPWILAFDADFRLARKDISRFGRLLKNPQADALRFTIRNYTDRYHIGLPWNQCRGEYPTEEKMSGCPAYYEFEKIILFRNRPELRFEMPVHETLTMAAARHDLRVRRAGIVIHHFELFKGRSHHLRKHRRYLELEKKAARRWPRFVPAHRNLIGDFILIGKLRQAEVSCRRFIRLFPVEPASWMLGGIMSLLLKKYRSASVRLERSVQLRPATDNLCLLGWVRLKEKKWAQAKRALNAALKLKAGNPLALNLLGTLEAKKGNNTRALSYFQAASKTLPTFREALKNQAAVLQKLKGSD